MAEWPRILPVGDQALVVEFGDVISPDVNDRVYEFAAAVERAADERIGELIPTYRSLLIGYDAGAATFGDMRDLVSQLLDAGTGTETGTTTPKNVFELPVAYGGEYGPDLATVAEHAGMPEDRVIEIHSGSSYRVFMLGFAPGFPYLGGMDQAIACPRLKTPRIRVPAGSVGIAESQTGVYPNESPGGWQLIGRTPVRLFDPSAEPPAVIQPELLCGLFLSNQRSSTKLRPRSKPVATGCGFPRSLNEPENHGYSTWTAFHSPRPRPSRLSAHGCVGERGDGH